VEFLILGNDNYYFRSLIAVEKDNHYFHKNKIILFLKNRQNELLWFIVCAGKNTGASLLLLYLCDSLFW
jgi:hypothetical protein